MLLSANFVFALTPNYKGIYIDSFDGIVGNTFKEDSLLHYLQDSSFNSIICYRMSNVVSATLTSTKNTTLANFLKRARTQFGIKNVIASSESYDTFKNLIGPYNRSRTDSLERFNYYYLEFEFWNVHSTSPVSSANNGYYCTNYLSPKGYNCDTSGAFSYYKKMLKSLDSLATKDGIRSATYVGNPNQGQCKFIASTVDLLFCDNYTTSVSNIFADVKTLFTYFGSTSKTLQIVPIFASYSPGGNFLGDWLSKAPAGPHSEKGVYYSYFLPRFNAETGAWKSKLNLVGYQWYRYSGMPHNGNYSTSTFCNPPTNLTASAITASSAKVAWTGISSGLGYVVQYRAVGTTTWSSPLAATTTSITISGLAASTNYEFQVKTSCISSSSSFTASSTFTTIASATCGTASSLTASSITDVSAVLNWASVTGASSYAIQYRKVGASVWTSASSTTTSKSISGLSASSIYEFQVQTICSSGSSVFSTSFLFSTLAPICVTPVGLNAISITSTSATLKWTAISGVSGYSIQYRLVGAAAWSTTTSTSASKSILALSSGSTYEFQVQTKCSATNTSSFSSSANFTTLANACGIPSNISATAATTSSFTVSWQANSAATSYTVQYRKLGNSSWTSVSTTTAYKNIPSLSSGTTYEFQVAMVCSSGTSNFSPIATVTTQSNLSSCGVPTGMFVSNVALTSVTLNWIAVSGASSYKVQYRKVGNSSWNSKTTNFTNKTITSLTANANYEFQVQTICSSGSSAYSSITNFITTPGVVTLRLAAPVAPNSTSTAANKTPKETTLLPENTKVEEFKIFPNPSNQENVNLRIQLKAKNLVKVQVYDMLGKLVYTALVQTDEYGFAETKIGFETELKVGIYLVIGTAEEQKFTCKLVLK